MIRLTLILVQLKPPIRKTSIDWGYLCERDASGGTEKSTDWDAHLVIGLPFHLGLQHWREPLPPDIPPQLPLGGQQDGGIGRTVMKHMSRSLGGQLLEQHMSILGGDGHETCWGQSSRGAMGLTEVGHLKLTTMGFGQHLTEKAAERLMKVTLWEMRWSMELGRRRGADLGSGWGHAGAQSVGGGQQGEGGHLGWHGFTITQQGGRGLQLRTEIQLYESHADRDVWKWMDSIYMRWIAFTKGSGTADCLGFWVEEDSSCFEEAELTKSQDLVTNNMNVSKLWTSHFNDQECMNCDDENVVPIMAGDGQQGPQHEDWPLAQGSGQFCGSQHGSGGQHLIVVANISEWNNIRVSHSTNLPLEKV